MNSPVEEIIENLCIDKKSNVLIYIQIVDAIIQSIQKGELRNNQKLPGTRKFAEILKLNRNTIVRSLEELQSLGYVKIIPNQGTYVISNANEKITAFTKSNFQEKSSFLFNQSILYDLPTKTKNFEIELNHGILDAREIEFNIPSKRYASILKSTSNFERITTNESLFFIKQLTNYINITRNLNIQPNNLLITRTPEMALQIISKVLLRDNSYIGIEKLSDYKSNMIFQANYAKLIPINSDENGIIIENLKRICQTKKIKAVYINASHSFPTTVSLSNQRKTELIDLSNQYGFVIIENDADFDYYYTHRPTYPLSTNNRLKNVIYTSQFGNELSPGFRLSYVIAPVDFIEESKKHLSIYESPLDPLALQTIAEMIYEGDIGRILKKQRKFYKERRDYFYNLFLENFDHKISITLPKNGLGFWIKFDKEINLLHLKNHLEKNNIYIPQHNLYQSENQCGIRLGFASLNYNEMIKVIEILKHIK